ncbi:MAG: hypothetical protein ACKOWQ_06170 [Aquirufa sp.]
MKNIQYLFLFGIICFIFSCHPDSKEEFYPTFRLIQTNKIHFNSFVDCNMAEAWIGDTLRIFPGKYGEDPLWGDAKDLKYSDGLNSMDVFSNEAKEFHNPKMPANVHPNEEGLHGAVWFETMYQDPQDKSGKTLFGIYHNENYPETFPYRTKTGKGYLKTKNWPRGITGPDSPAAVCRIGIMKSKDGGKSWENKGIFIEDLNDRMTLKPHNVSQTFAGGVGDPSAVVSGDHLYLFYGEYAYPGIYQPATFDPFKEKAGQCISVARIALKDLENPQGKAKRWGGSSFNIPFDSIGKPIKSLQIPKKEGGGPISSKNGGYYWGPSVSWNEYLNCWVMLMAKSEGLSWKGSRVYISFNPNKNLAAGNNSQAWTKPRIFFEKPGYILWYPSLQPLDDKESVQKKYTSLRLGKRARFFVKRMRPIDDSYASDFIIEFEK